MAWKPSRLTRAQMEERRRIGAQLLRQGKLSQAAIAQQLGVSRMAVSHWAKQLAQGGLRALRGRKAPGRRVRLTLKDQKAVVSKLKRGAVAAGFPIERWTMSRVHQLIEREFGVSYHLHSINRVLAKLDGVGNGRCRERQSRMKNWSGPGWPRIGQG